ncbi:MerR family transcriptional regulator [Streptomyces sp. NPDC005908]|uniref:MerR family transcriptional regulator n=1 Tax=unclassified Streptomyces TaxID=2593676 RepID=UPI00119F22F6|nr:MerR family transcriptional regulator [Streptomyces sp. T12]TWD29332.1 DNA-binding transcriptional MerR regulator [Streptomyces sp. T12]
MTTTDGGTASVSIQDMSKISGLSEATLRYYEKIGLIGPVPRDGSSGHRRYGGHAVEMIEALGCLRATGTSVQDMRDYLRFLDGGDDNATRMRELFERNVSRIQEEIERMHVRRRYLELKAQLWTARERGDTDGENRIVPEIALAREGLR